jgi:uncharacterized protein with HEPN domain
VPPTIEDRLLDILEAIGDVETILHGKTFEQFTEDRTLRFATERLLEIVCEASRKLPDSLKQDGPDINWQKWSISAISCATHIMRLMLLSSGTSLRSICRR